MHPPLIHTDTRAPPSSEHPIAGGSIHVVWERPLAPNPPLLKSLNSHATFHRGFSSACFIGFLVSFPSPPLPLLPLVLRAVLAPGKACHSGCRCYELPSVGSADRVSWRSSRALPVEAKRALPLLQTKRHMNETTPSTPIMQAIDEAATTGSRRFRRKTQPQEWGLISLRECPLPTAMHECTSPAQAATYWNMHLRSNPYFNPEVECFVVLLLNTRKKIKGHVLVSTGLMDQVLIHPRETFRAAVIASAHSVILMHNHPSGDVSPSEADIRVTRELIRAGQVLRIEVLDHVIVGGNEHRSLRELGYLS